MIKFKNIPDNELDKLINKLDETISFVNSEFGFELKSYGNISSDCHKCHSKRNY